jgi:uroporphyrinogen decarboxylase
MMNGRERILTALRCEQPDRVPIAELYINESSLVRLADLLNIDTSNIRAAKDRFGEERYEMLDIYCKVVEKLQIDASCTNFSIGLEQLDASTGRDKFGTVYRLSEHGEPFPMEGPIKERSDTRGFDMVSKLHLRDFSRVQYVIEKLGSSRAHMVSITDPFKVSWRRRGGMQKLLVDFVLNPGLVHDLARIATDFDMAAVDMAIEVGADVIIMPGDLAGEDTTIMSPEHYREYIKPYHREITNHVHARGSKIVKHSDGNVWPILEDFIEVGFDGIHPIQPQCMDISEVKKHLAGRACVLGNIDCRNLLVFGTEKEVEKSVRETIDAAAPGGGYIITSSNSIHPGCRAENYVAMVQAAHKFGVYAA